MLVPVECAACGAPARQAVCQVCLAALRPAPDLDPPPGVAAAVAVCSYEGTGAELVRALKYRRCHTLGRPLGAAMARLARLEGVDDVDVVTWVPTTAAGRRRRGYDQGRVLAGAVAGGLGLPARRLLRARRGRGQTGRGRDERLALLSAERFHVVRRVPRWVLLVDDVRTTGATLAAAAAALHAAGARTVVAVTVAATPGPGSRAGPPPSTYDRRALRWSGAAAGGPDRSDVRPGGR